jgi:hypothetical protein
VGRGVNGKAGGEGREHMPPSEHIINDRGGNRKKEVRIVVKGVVEKL